MLVFICPSCGYRTPEDEPGDARDGHMKCPQCDAWFELGCNLIEED